MPSIDTAADHPHAPLYDDVVATVPHLSRGEAARRGLDDIRTVREIRTRRHILELGSGPGHLALHHADVITIGPCGGRLE